MLAPRIIDCGYLHPEFAAAYLLVEGDEAAFVEANTAHALPRLLQALAEAGRAPEELRYLIVTHVHLDHAGGASALMKACPNATLLAHPRAARHLVDPSRLVASARAVYGAEEFRRLYGEIEPIEAGRVRVLEDDTSLVWGSRRLRFLHMRGHANHHFVVHDSLSDGVFTGDAFGLRYPALQKRGLLMLPSTSPTDFDPGAAKESVRRIAKLGSRAFLTHYGEVSALREAEEQLLGQLDFSEALLDEAAERTEEGEALERFCERALLRHCEERFGSHGLSGEDWALLSLDLKLNAQGIAWAAVRRRAA